MRDVASTPDPWSTPRCLFLFGAGASFGAGEVHPKSPSIGPYAPLGKHLFTEMRAAFPETWGALEPSVVHLFDGGKNFEAGMGEIAERNDFDFGPLLVDLGIYFSRFRPVDARTMLYTELINAFCGAGIDPLLVTLNYECLLQICVRASGHRRLDVLPLHGACNLLPAEEIRGMTFAGNGRIYGGTCSAHHHTCVERWYRVEGHTIPPVMRVYAARKPSPVCPEVTAKYAAVWQARAACAEHLFIVGANPSFQDAHVWEPILASRANVYYVGGLTGDVERLQQELGSRMKVLGETFSDAMPELVAKAHALASRAAT